MNATLDVPPADAPDTPAPLTEDPTPAPTEPADDGDGLDPGQTTADNHGDVLGI